MPSYIRGSDNFDSTGGNAVKAWVNFNGTGTVAIRAAFNVSSITDNGVGDYTVNFTTAMADANYSTVVANEIQINTAFGWIGPQGTSTTSSVRIQSASSGGSGVDRQIVNVAVFR